MHFKLTEEIIKLSVSKYWEIAKNEWDFDYAYQSEEFQTCLCGHYPIKNICVIKNDKNGNETEVGNCCINKFLGIEKGNKIFDSINRLKDDISKSLSAEVLEYLFEKNVITEFEYEFYSDTLRKRVLSEKQMSIREKINKKFLDFTSYETNTFLNRINMVLKWSEDNKWFDRKFVDSLKRDCERKGTLSEKQSSALENIIKKMKIQ
ncbi:hypothetical protein SAMN05216490_4729 [Mucilaginibacter mallensis]|uniref:Uncharacterized protein n=1 Tax=Mucilaginibacter mallensis TaxID=652787 RepID=A0A1H2C8F4_MUCMA|nr:hypothetical protein [Mucilaginibacter mallensis]SDT66750.1 hypothetical protein SAMN05216490_4729 [Mucilaginibacter mallensis]